MSPFQNCRSRYRISVAFEITTTLFEDGLNVVSALLLIQGTEWQRNNARKTDLVTMMQIDCQVMDTKFINIKKSSIPMPHPDSSSFGTSTPVSVPRDFSAPSGNTFVKPTK